MTTPPEQGIETPRSSRSNHAALGIVWLVVFIDLLGFGIVLPVLPRQAELYLQGLTPGARGAVIGILFSIFSLMQFIFSPVWGRISDRIGRKPVLLISLSGSVVFYALYGFAVTFDSAHAPLAIGLMLLSRIGAGIAGASVGTAAAVIADCTPPEKRAKGMALIGIAFGAGFTFGPLIAYFGLALFDQEPWGVGALASALSFLALVTAVLIFEETHTPSKVGKEFGGGPRTGEVSGGEVVRRGYEPGKEFFSIRRTVEVMRMPTVGKLITMYFLAIFAFAQFEATLALFTGAAFGMSVEDNFLVFALVGGVLTFAGGAYRGFVRRRTEHQMLSMGLILMLAGLGGLAAVAWAAPGEPSALAAVGSGLASATQAPASGWLKAAFYCSMAIAVIGFAFVNPSVSALVSKRADPARQGEVLGVNQSFASLGRILGPFLGSVLFQAGVSHTLPYLAAVGLLVLVASLLPRIKASDSPQRHEEGTKGHKE